MVKYALISFLLFCPSCKYAQDKIDFTKISEKLVYIEEHFIDGYRRQLRFVCEVFCNTE